MPTYLHPGVYIEEIPGGARPIEAVGTSTAVFVGIAERGPIDRAVFITNFDEYQKHYGGYIEADEKIGRSYLPHAVRQFFENGGRSCYVVRVEQDAKTAECTLYNSAGEKTLTVYSSSPGAWGNDLRIAVRKSEDDPNAFSLYVLKKDKNGEVKVMDEFHGLSMIDTSENFVDKVAQDAICIRAKSEPLSDNPTLKGKKIEGTVDLHTVKCIKLQIDDFDALKIDCSANSSGEERSANLQDIAQCINNAFADDIRDGVASVEEVEGSKKRLVITSPTANEKSKIVLTYPEGPDATFDIFGLEEWTWEIKAGEQKETLAQAFGMKDLSVEDISECSLSIAVGDDNFQKINIDQSDALLDIVNGINQIHGIAYTDGKHIVLMSDKDIRFERPNQAIADIFGTGFYSYVHEGNTNETVKIAGAVDISSGSSITGKLRLKIDNLPGFEVVFDAAENAGSVAAMINEAFKRATGKATPVAGTDGDKVTLSSIKSVENGGRIIITSLPKDDAAQAIFGNNKNSPDDTKEFLFPAEQMWVAKLETPENESFPEAIGDEIAGKKLRISAGGEPVNINNIPTEFDTNIIEFFSALKVNTGLNHKLLAKRADSKDTVHLLAASLDEKPTIYLSIPVDANGLHAEGETGETQKAYIRLFGSHPNIFGFEDETKTTPKYRHLIGLPDNRPKSTFSEGDPVFGQAFRFEGGDHDRSNETTLTSLTLGKETGSGLNLLDRITGISILVIPGWENMGPETAKAIIDGGTAYCDKVRPAAARPVRDLFFITNTPEDIALPTEAKNFARNEIGYRSAGGYAALYYPWVSVTNPLGDGTIAVPPAGMVAGLYASIDGRRGVWKAPAGAEAGLAGVVKLQEEVTDIEQDILNPFSVNVIRRMPGAGVVSWGARTIHTNPEWRYVPVRRTAIMIEVSIYENIQWAVFEPNDEQLWSSLRVNIESFMNGLFRSGAFQGGKASDAYFVRCGLGDTMTQGDIDRGQVIVIVGFAPLKPAEFVIVRIQQKAGQK